LREFRETFAEEKKLAWILRSVEVHNTQKSIFAFLKVLQKFLYCLFIAQRRNNPTLWNFHNILALVKITIYLKRTWKIMYWDFL